MTDIHLGLLYIAYCIFIAVECLLVLQWEDYIPGYTRVETLAPSAQSINSSLGKLSATRNMAMSSL